MSAIYNLFVSKMSIVLALDHIFDERSIHLDSERSWSASIGIKYTLPTLFAYEK